MQQRTIEPAPIARLQSVFSSKVATPAQAIRAPGLILRRKLEAPTRRPK